MPSQVAAPQIVKTGLETLRDIMLVDQQNQPRDKNNPCNRLGKLILFYFILFNDISKIHNYFLLNYSDLPDKRAANLIDF